jgi:quinohemoprotein ethanol dehydrogenase
MLVRKPLTMVMIGLAALSLAGCRRSGPADRPGKDGVAAANAILADGSSGDDWPGYGRTYGEQHFSPLADINDRNVDTLGLAWSMDLGTGSATSIPVEVGGTLYMSTGLSIVRAVDAATGKLLWTYDSRVADHAGKEMRAFWGIRGIAWWNGKVYTATVDGRLIAIDAKSGKEVWSVQTIEKGNGQFITGAPRAFDGKIVIGQAGGDSTPARGYATAYDAETGRQLWRFFAVPGDPAKGFENKAMEMAARTWKGEWWKFGGGGEPWNAFTYDAETDTLLIGTGNGFPWNRKIRSPGGGDNLFVCSMIAVDAKTGAYKWHYQFNPGETWDYNAAMDMALADLTIDGQPRKVVMTAPKNGFLYVIDRTNGRLISAGRIAKVTWATRIDVATGRPVETPAARFENGQTFELWPSYTGAHSWMPMAFSPKTGLVYVPKLEWGAKYTDKGIDPGTWKPGNGSVGVMFDVNVKDPLNFSSSLLAWNPVTQQRAWEVKTVGGWNGGILATAGNLVFQGQLDGRFSAYTADKGNEVWHFPAQAVVLAAPITYRVDGKQYVTVLVGMGSSASVDVRAQGGIAIDPRTEKKRVLTFVLDGKAALPPAPPAFVLKAAEDPGYMPDAALAARGATIFGINCAVCHGFDAKAGGYGPDLRGSVMPQSAEAFDSVVRDGAVVANGMPKFAELTDQERAALRQYLRSRAADLRAGK